MLVLKESKGPRPKGGHPSTAASFLLALLLSSQFGSGSSAIDSAQPATTILCLGDSLTEGFGVREDQSFPAVLERRLYEMGYRNMRVVNGGISASTSASGTERLRAHLRDKPSILILALGANDGLRWRPLKELRRDLSQTIELAQKNGVEVVLAGMKLPPAQDALEYTHDFERVFGDVAKERNVTLIPFLLEGVAGKSELTLQDGVHPNARGYEIVASTVLRYVRSLLPQTSITPQPSLPPATSR